MEFRTSKSKVAWPTEPTEPTTVQPWPTTKAVAGKIQKLQNRAARVLTSASYDTSTDFLLDKLGWKYLKTQRKIVEGTMV